MNSFQIILLIISAKRFMYEDPFASLSMFLEKFINCNPVSILSSLKKAKLIKSTKLRLENKVVEEKILGKGDEEVAHGIQESCSRISTTGNR